MAVTVKIAQILAEYIPAKGVDVLKETGMDNYAIDTVSSRIQELQQLTC